MKVRRYLLSIGIVLAATAVALPLRDRIAHSELVMVYFLAIVVAAVCTSRGPAFLAAAVSVALFDVLFIEPHGTFRVDDTRHLPTFAMMLVVGVVVGSLTARLREREAAELRARTEEMRSRLLSSVSHDLRTPLATIKGVATALLEGGFESAARRDLLAMVQEEADRLERLVANLLAMTRVESGALRVKKEWVPLDEVIGSAVRRFDARLAGRLAIEVSDALVPLDDVLVENVLVNVLENAIRHTPAQTPIEIRATTSASEMVLEIADRGPGFPRGAEEKLFEKFWQGDGERSGGAGLGLPICRGIAEAHGGSMTALAREGGGAIFRLALPIDGAAPSAPLEQQRGAS